jgi:hypothetical protein
MYRCSKIHPKLFAPLQTQVWVGQTAKVGGREGRPSNDNAYGTHPVLPPTPPSLPLSIHLHFPSFCDVVQARKYFASSVFTMPDARYDSRVRLRVQIQFNT